MENASKALIIAGSILIAMITISIFYGIYGRMSDTADATSPNTEQKELEAFNSRFEAYNKNVMYGIDIISVINMAEDNNKRYGVEIYDENNEFIDYYVNVKIKYGSTEYSLINNGYEAVKNLINAYEKISAYKCNNVKYVDTCKYNIGAKGRVKEMTFIKK